MSTVRRYDDPCGIARALDVVGDRWALLVVRELIFGPKRFVQLRDGLHGISPNVLSQRLRELEDTGLVRRAVLDPPASVAIYELTDRGRALEPVLLELGRWGSQQEMTSSNELSVSAVILALKTLFQPDPFQPDPFQPDPSTEATVALRINGEWYRLTVNDGSFQVVQARAERPVVTIETDVATLRAITLGRQPLTEAEGDGRLRLTGDRATAERFTRLFRVPS
jgi:DNA-binding HxlR family transcriptional regulator